MSVPLIATEVGVPRAGIDVDSIAANRNRRSNGCCAGIEGAIEGRCRMGNREGRGICRTHDVRVRSCKRFAVNSRTRESNYSEEDQSDQENDQNPGNGIRDNDAVPQLAIRRAVLFQYRSACVFCDHRVLPGKIFRDRRFVGGSHFGFLRSRGHLQTQCVNENIRAEKTTRRHLVFNECDRSND